MLLQKYTSETERWERKKISGMEYKVKYPN
jgi:hypothetical protein